MPRNDLTAFVWTVKQSDIDAPNLELRLREHTAYSVWQLEEGAGGYRHWQGYSYLGVGRRRRMSTVKRNILCASAHVEPRRGTHAEAKQYCTKADTRVAGPFECGDESCVRTQGQRTDLDALAARVIAGDALATIAAEHGAQFLRYHTGIRALRAATTTPYSGNREVIWIYGPPGVGKTWYATHTFPGIFRVPQFSRSTQWFDGLDQQKAILLDNMTTDFPWHMLMAMLDSYPLSVPVKGGFQPACWETVVLTSVQDPLTLSKVYCSTGSSHNYCELMRRLTKIIQFIPGEGDPPRVLMERKWNPLFMDELLTLAPLNQ